MAVIKQKDIEYTASPKVVQISQADYDALPNEIKNNGQIYMIENSVSDKQLELYPSYPIVIGEVVVGADVKPLSRKVFYTTTPAVPTDGTAASKTIDISDLHMTKPFSISGVGLLGGAWQNIPTHPDAYGNHFVKAAVNMDSQKLVIVTNHKGWENSDIVIILDYM